MIQDLHEPISVKTIYDHKNHRVYPAELLWQNQRCKITNVALHHTYKTGAALFHVYSVSTDLLSFKLQLDTSNLFWTVEQIADGLPD